MPVYDSTSASLPAYNPRPNYVSPAKAVDTTDKAEATVTLARLKDMRCFGVGRLKSPK
jgi:hypothetical protein